MEKNILKNNKLKRNKNKLDNNVKNRKSFIFLFVQFTL